MKCWLMSLFFQPQLSLWLIYIHSMLLFITCSCLIPTPHMSQGECVRFAPKTPVICLTVTSHLVIFHMEQCNWYTWSEISCVVCAPSCQHGNSLGQKKCHMVWAAQQFRDFQCLVVWMWLKQHKCGCVWVRVCERERKRERERERELEQCWHS